MYFETAEQYMNGPTHLLDRGGWRTLLAVQSAGPSAICTWCAMPRLP